MVAVLGLCFCTPYRSAPNHHHNVLLVNDFRTTLDLFKSSFLGSFQTAQTKNGPQIQPDHQSRDYRLKQLLPHPTLFPTTDISTIRAIHATMNRKLVRIMPKSVLCRPPTTKAIEHRVVRSNYCRQVSSETAASKQGYKPPYGLRMPDYSTPPPRWPLPPHPPMQRTQKVLIPCAIATFVLGFTYIYFNQEEDMYEYWKEVETGNVPMDDDDDDDDDDES